MWKMIHLLKNVLRRLLQKNYWIGDYPNWEDAMKNSRGYDSDIILEKVKIALLKVKNGEAAFERDSVTFQKHEYVWPVLSGLLWISAQRKGSLNVLDFGGALGSTYFQYRKFLMSLQLKWNIVEQENFVRCGKENFEDDTLRFFLTAEDCFAKNAIDVVLFSSVLPYLREPYKTLESIIKLNPAFIIFDKMPFLLENRADLLTVQKVDPAIYTASYPAWFFNKEKFLTFLEPFYYVVEEFQDVDVANVPSTFTGIILQKRNS